MAVDNNTILTKSFIEGSNDFQQRLPDPDQATMKQTMDAIFAPMNGRLYNEFVDILVNRIGDTLVHQKEWENPLNVFKSSRLNYGTTVQEIATKWVQAHSYDDAAETLLKMNRPEAEACYHTMNRQDRYDITVNRDELRQAFLEEFGLNNFVNSILQVPINSDNYDEYRSMLQLIAYYENSWGFFKHNLSAAPSDLTTSQELLKAIRTYSGKLRFPSTLYNAGVIKDIPVFARPDELVLMITPEYDAAIDVDALAVLFNMDKAQINVRKIIVDEFPIPDAVALLTTQDFFICRDTEYTTASFYNPQTLSTNYFLHHWSILSVSPFVPAILFTTAEGTTPSVIEITPSTLSVVADPDEVEAGGETQLTITLSGTVDPEDALPVEPQACTFALSASLTTEGAGDDDPDVVTPVQLNSRTYVDRKGVLHVQKRIETGTVITIEATSTYINPSGATEAITATETVEIV